MCALSADRTGSCQLDEKYLTKSVLAVQILHPAAAHNREDDKDVNRIPAVRGFTDYCKGGILLCKEIKRKQDGL